MADILNRSSQNNYVSGHSIFILDKLNTSTTAELIGNITNMVKSLPWNPVFTTTPLFKESAKLENPYQLDEKYPPVIDIYINSGGGNNNILHSISTLLDMAKFKGAIIRTTILGTAASCASMLAVQGTPGFRIMGETSHHFIHFGSTTMNAERAGEIETSAKAAIYERKQCSQIYLNNTKIPDKQLKKYMSTEGAGELSPKQCLQLGICDWILTSTGRFIR